MSYENKRQTELITIDNEDGAKINLNSELSKESTFTCPLEGSTHRKVDGLCDKRCVNYEPATMAMVHLEDDKGQYTIKAWRVYKGYCTNGMFSDYRYVENA